MDSDFSYVSYFHVIFIFSVILSVYSMQLSSTILFETYCSEDEYRLEKSRRDRGRYIRKLLRHKNAAFLAIEPQSAETQVLPMTTAPQTTEHNLFDVPVHHDLPAKHAVGCFCLDLPVFSLPDNTDIPSTSTVSSIDPFCPAINDDSVSQSFFNSVSSHVHVHQFPLPPHSASNSSINEGSNIATSSNLRPGNHRRRTNIPVEQIYRS
ncbi:uncharacterized protein [Coffea arabica]|uniref:Uncharacterized protein isoform X2 n=1 Tax=Coffea arabica TaxID=13443 RepID=A0ABM4VDT6_COFAR